MSWHPPVSRATKPSPAIPERSPRHARRRTSPLLEITVMVAVTAAVTIPLGLGLGWFGPRWLGGEPPARVDAPTVSAGPVLPPPDTAPAPRVPFRAAVLAPPGDRPGPATASPGPSRTAERSKRPESAPSPPERSVSPSPPTSPLVPPVLPDPSESVSPTPQAACVLDAAKVLLTALKGARQ